MSGTWVRAPLAFPPERDVGLFHLNGRKAFFWETFMTASALGASSFSLSRRERALRRVETLALVLDSAATIPFTRIRIGADALL